MPPNPNEQSRLVTGSLIIIAALGIAAVLYFTRPVIVPFVLAVFTFSLVSPVLDHLVLRFRLPRFLAVAVSFLIVVVAILIFCLVMVSLIQSVVATTFQYSESFAIMIENVLSKLGTWGVEVDQAEVAKEIQSRMINFVSGRIGTVFDFVTTVVLLLIFVYFLLAGRDPHAIRARGYEDMDRQVRKYIATKIVVSLMTGVLVWIALSLFGLRLAAVFGVLAFLLNFVPSIGSVIATLLPIPIAVVQFGSPGRIIAAVVVTGVIELFIGNGLEPKLMGRELNLHPVTIIMSLAIWGILWGVVGMLLAVPMTAIIRIILMQTEIFRPIGLLLAGTLPRFDMRDDDIAAI